MIRLSGTVEGQQLYFGKVTAYSWVVSDEQMYPTMKGFIMDFPLDMHPLEFIPLARECFEDYKKRQTYQWVTNT